jgi:hypothetical protein
MQGEPVVKEPTADIELPLFVLDGQRAAKWIPALIARYVPFGPIEDRYLFVLRSRRSEIVRTFVE